MPVHAWIPIYIQSYVYISKCIYIYIYICKYIFSSTYIIHNSLYINACMNIRMHVNDVTYMHKYIDGYIQTHCVKTYYVQLSFMLFVKFWHHFKPSFNLGSHLTITGHCCGQQLLWSHSGQYSDRCPGVLVIREPRGRSNRSEPLAPRSEHENLAWYHVNHWFACSLLLVLAIFGCFCLPA